MSLEQIIVLAVVQGITEFLPISSLGHLILIPFLTGWPDQGQFTDVMTHLGTLLAVLIYFWRDVWRLILGTLMLFRGKVTGDGRLALYILAGTVPAVLFGFVLKKLNVPDLERNITVVAWNTVIYGVLMLIADMYGRQEKTINEVTLKKRCADRMRASAGAYPRDQPFRRHHDCGALSELHPSQCSSLLVSPRYPCYDRRYRAHRGRRLEERLPHHLRRVFSRGSHIRRRHSGDRLLDEPASADQLPAVCALPHGARWFSARACLWLRRAFTAGVRGKLRPWSTGWRAIGSSVGAGTIARLSQGR